MVLTKTKLYGHFFYGEATIRGNAYHDMLVVFEANVRKRCHVPHFANIVWDCL